MKLKISNENQVLQGNTYTEIVEQLRDGSKFAFNENIATYMKGFSTRYAELTGENISFESAETFVEGLLRAKYLIAETEKL